MGQKRTIKYHPDLLWLKPYIEASLKYVPRHTRITKIHAVKPQPNKKLGFYGKLQENGSGGLIISLYTHYHDPSPRSRRILPFSKIDILQTAAHEMAHCAIWDHTPKHKILENKICNLFMRMLLANGYESEEVELKNKRSIS